MNLKEYFKRIDLREIHDFVTNQVAEDIFLEFKTANYPQGIDFDKKNFSKCLSGFANSSGGILIWGISAKETKNKPDVANELKPIKDIIEFENYLKKIEGNAVAEEQEILNNENIGWSRELREEKLSNAKKISRIINWLGGISFAWTLFYPKPYDLAVLSALVVPIIALIAVKLSGGLIRIDQKNGSAYPSTIYAFIFPSLGLVVRSFFDYDIFDYSNVWLKAVLITVAFLFLLIEGIEYRRIF